MASYYTDRKHYTVHQNALFSSFSEFCCCKIISQLVKAAGCHFWGSVNGTAKTIVVFQQVHPTLKIWFCQNMLYQSQSHEAENWDVSQQITEELSVHK